MRDVSSNLITLWLSEAALDAIRTESQDKYPLETGGVLLGYETPRGADIVITNIIGPGPRAQHSRIAYVPDHAYQEDKIASAYRASGRTTTYLGDWHSHPDGPLRLSRTDRRTMRTIAAHENARARQPLMMIATVGDDGSCDLAIWRWLPQVFRWCGRATRVERVRVF